MKRFLNQLKGSINILTSALILVVILITLIFLADFNLSERLNNTLTPFFTLFTGIIIFYSFRENQKSNKIILSEKLLKKFEEKLAKHTTNRKVKFNGIRFSDGVHNVENNNHTFFEYINRSDTQNWLTNLHILINELKNNDYYEHYIDANKKGDFRVEHIDSCTEFYIYEKVDYLLKAIKGYYLYLQDHLYNLATDEYTDIISMDKIFFIDKIVTETEYKEFFHSIEKYFHLNDKGEVELTTSVDTDNVNLLWYNMVENKLEVRRLIDWDIFSDLYKRNKDIIELMK